MFRANTRCQILPKMPTRTIHGKEVFGTPFPAACSVVHLRSDTGQSSVRADQSASRGSMEQMTAAAKILFPPRTKIVHGDVVRIHSMDIAVTGIEQRFDVRGQLDHLEVVGDIRSAV